MHIGPHNRIPFAVNGIELPAPAHQRLFQRIRAGKAAAFEARTACGGFLNGQRHIINLAGIGEHQLSQVMPMRSDPFITGQRAHLHQLRWAALKAKRAGADDGQAADPVRIQRSKMPGTERTEGKPRQIIAAARRQDAIQPARQNLRHPFGR